MVDMHTKHGGAKRENEDRLYHIWRAMKRRCADKNDANYGGRGISVCKEWADDYSVFKEWAYNNGYDENADKGQCTIDRIDVDGNYEPSNCRWVDMVKQANNTRKSRYVDFQGRTMTIAEFSRAMNIKPTHAWYYINKFEKEINNE